MRLAVSYVFLPKFSSHVPFPVHLVRLARVLRLFGGVV